MRNAQRCTVCGADKTALASRGTRCCADCAELLRDELSEDIAALLTRYPFFINEPRETLAAEAAASLLEPYAVGGGAYRSIAGLKMSI